MKKSNLTAAAIFAILIGSTAAVPSSAANLAGAQPVNADAVPFINYQAEDAQKRRIENKIRIYNDIKDDKRHLRNKTFRYCYKRHGRTYCRKNSG